MLRNGYEITVTVNPRKRFGLPMRYGQLRPSEQFNLLRDEIIKVCGNYPFMLFPEFHKNMNIHVHGILFAELNEFQRIDIDKHLNQIGRSNFGSINNYNSWRNYCVKDQAKLGNLNYIHKSMEFFLYEKELISGLSTQQSGLDTIKTT